jgi:pimeloyl-ACP methyl ester carboxylesterase
VTLTDREQREVEAANASGRQPVIFVHGLWLHASSWDAWRALFDERGFAPLAPGWPGEPATVADARARPEAVAGVGVGDATAHHADVARALARPPIIIGHSFGGLIAQKLAGQGRVRATVAIDPAPFRGVLPLPLSALRASSPVLRNPRNRKRSVSLTAEQFRYAFTNAVPEAEAEALYDGYAVPAPGRPLFQAAVANFSPHTEASVEVHNADRGPLLVISGEHDHTIPWSMANAAYKRQEHAGAPTEIIEIPGRGHSLTIDSGWREVAETALAFLDRYGVGA